MPVACSQSVLTGVDGSIYFEPAGTEFCLLDNTDFPAGTVINVPSDNDFRVGDPVVFTEEGTSSLDTALTAGTTYYVVARTATTISVSATSGGAAITLKGDGGLGGPAGGVVTAITAAGLPTSSGSYGAGPYTGIATTGTTGSGLTVDVTVTSSNVTAVAVNAGGTGYTAGDTVKVSGALLGGASPADDLTITIGTASPITAGGDTAGAGNHIEVAYAEFEALCSVKEWSLDLSRESIDTTTLPCAVSGGASKYAAFRTQTSGFASGEGSMSVLFSADQGSLANRLMANSMLKNSTAYAKLYVNAVAGAGTTLNDTASSYFEGEISLQGFSISVNPDDAITAEINFSLSAQPKAIFGVTLS